MKNNSTPVALLPLLLLTLLSSAPQYPCTLFLLRMRELPKVWTTCSTTSPPQCPDSAACTWTATHSKSTSQTPPRKSWPSTRSEQYSVPHAYLQAAYRLSKAPTDTINFILGTTT